MMFVILLLLSLLVVSSYIRNQVHGGRARAPSRAAHSSSSGALYYARMYVLTCVCIYIYIYIYRERERYADTA